MLLTDDDESFQNSVAKTELSEQEVISGFITLQDRYLGPPSDIDEAMALFRQWTAIRETNRELAKTGKVKDAIIRLTDTGDIGSVREALFTQIRRIDTTSYNIALELHTASFNLKKRLTVQLIYIIINHCIIQCS